MSYIAIHAQDEFPDWDLRIQQAANAGNPFRLVKFFQTEPYNIVKSMSPSTNYIFRQHADKMNQGAWIERAGISEAEADAAADEFIATFRDSVNQHMGTDNNGKKYVESLNEEYPTANVDKLQKSVEFDRAFIRRLPVHCPGVKPAVFTAAIGNPGHDEYEHLIPLAIDSNNGKALWCYHGYWTVYRGHSYIFDEPQATDLHGRWNAIDNYMKARGYNLTWALTETGADKSDSGDGYNPSVLAGWKHADAWGGDITKYVQDIANFDRYLEGTLAAREGRLLGATLFTSKISPGQWKDFNLLYGDLERVTEYVAGHPTPEPIPPAPPPPPPPEPVDRGQPRVQYGRKVRVIPPGYTIEQAHQVLDEAWANRNTVGWSYDDAGIGDLDSRTAILYGIPVDEQQAMMAWYILNYPGVVVQFADVAPGGPPDNPVIVDIVDQLPTNPDHPYTTRPLSAITTITVHHTTGGPFQSLANIATFHISKGWGGIAYHYCIDGDGVIYQTQYAETKSFHAGSANAPGDENYWSIAVCLQGNFQESPPPQPQLDSARAIVQYLKQTLGVESVLGHKNMPGASTACPGATFAQWLPYVAGS